MAESPMPAEKRLEAVVAELRKIRATAQEEPITRRPEDVLPSPRPIGPVLTPPDLPDLPPTTSPAHPDSAPVNALWQLPDAVPPPGIHGVLFRLLRRFLKPVIEAQVAFNSRQVQLDNELLVYLNARLAETHKHYDRVLGEYGQHITDANERHVMLQREVVAHVHDLVKRIDLVLAESERGRLSADAGLRDVRARLGQLEERLRS
jgi:hypothetical protein